MTLALLVAVAAAVVVAVAGAAQHLTVFQTHLVWLPCPAAPYAVHRPESRCSARYTSVAVSDGADDRTTAN
jgi:hypothetical protein